MAYTFDIRFARSVGWSALIEEPGNSFRWKGGGLLSIDAEGVSIAVKRGLLTLRGQSCRIAADDLTAVYREADALRLEFSTPEALRTILPFWVSNRRVAAEIVTLLPTQRTVELEHSTAGCAQEHRFDRRLVAWLLAGLIALGFGALALPRYLAQSTVQSSAAVRSMHDASPVALPAMRESARKPTGVPSAATTRTHDSPAPAQHASEVSVPRRRNPADSSVSATDTAESLAAGSNAEVSPLGWSVRGLVSGEVIRVARGTPAYAAARRQLDTFEAESAALRACYLEILDSPTADNLEALDERWWKVTMRIYDSEEMQDPALKGLREIELAVARSWHSFLASYAEGLRTRDEGLVATAFAELKFAQVLAVRAHQYVL